MISAHTDYDTIALLKSKESQNLDTVTTGAKIKSKIKDIVKNNDKNCSEYQTDNTIVPKEQQ